MKIAIIGAGAMGCLFGAKLAEREENQVFLIDIVKENTEAITRHGIKIEEEGSVSTYQKVNATTDGAQVGICDLVILFVKSTSTLEAIQKNRMLFDSNTCALTLQNGLGNVEFLSNELGPLSVLAGTTAHGATFLGAGIVRHAGKGKTIIGNVSGNQLDRIETIAKVLNDAGIDTAISDNPNGVIWDKLLVNVGINALTAIGRIENGKLLEMKESCKLLEEAVSEGHAISKAKGIQLHYKDPINHTKEICMATATNKSSMLQDILNKRQTEIDMINGAIVREGQSLGIKTPVNHVLTNLIKMIEAQN